MAALEARFVPAAVYDAQLGTGCIEGTRIGILQDVEAWIKNPKGPQIFWLTGMSGMGRSTIAWSCCSRASEDSEMLLGGSFFCSRSTGLVAQRDVLCVVPTLVQLLARQSTKFSLALADELARDPDVLHKQVGVQVQQLLYKPLLALKGTRVPIVFVIDGLDECGGQILANGPSAGSESHSIISDMVEALVALSRSPIKLPVKFIITSRPETRIRNTSIYDSHFSAVIRLHTISKEQTSADIRLYIATTLSRPASLRARFTEEDREMLLRLCDGLFIVAAIALRYALGASIDLAPERLRTLLNSARDKLTTVAAAPLDCIYDLILSDGATVNQPNSGEHLALASLLCARAPLSVSALADLLGMKRHQLRASLSNLYAVLHVPDDDGEPSLRMHHASFGDYLIDRAPGHLRISEPFGHDTLARGCFRVMKTHLHFNVSGSRSSYEPNSGIKPASITLSLEYACLQWIYHTIGLVEPMTLNELIDGIFRPRFLFWLEVMSVLCQLRRAAAMIFLAAATVSLIIQEYPKQLLRLECRYNLRSCPCFFVTPALSLYRRGRLLSTVRLTFISQLFLSPRRILWSTEPLLRSAQVSYPSPRTVLIDQLGGWS